MKAYQWIDRLKVQKKLPSDYAAAKLLGMTTAAIAMLRARESTLSEEISLKIANELGINPVLVLTDQVTERAKSDGARQAWHRFLQELMDQEKNPALSGIGISGAGGLCILC